MGITILYIYQRMRLQNKGESLLFVEVSCKELNKLIPFIKLMKAKPVQKNMGKGLHKADENPNSLRKVWKESS
jgi:hypothetical protein